MLNLSSVTLAGLSTMRRLTFTLSVSILAGALLCPAADDPLNAVYARLDAAAKNFKGIAADITDIEHHALVPDSDDVANGTIKLLRVNPTTTKALMAVKGDTGDMVLSLDGHKGRSWNRKTNIVDEMDLGDKQATLNQLLLLGFGGTSAELKNAYEISYVGEEKLNGQQTSHIKLVPKSAETRRSYKQADLWFTENGLVAQQKFLFPSGDTRLMKYSNVKPGAIPAKDLELQLPKNATIQKH